MQAKPHQAFELSSGYTDFFSHKGKPYAAHMCQSFQEKQSKIQDMHLLLAGFDCNQSHVNRSSISIMLTCAGRHASLMPDLGCCISCHQPISCTFFTPACWNHLARPNGTYLHWQETLMQWNQTAKREVTICVVMHASQSSNMLQPCCVPMQHT